MMKNRVIIWGVDDYNTLALIRQIGQGEYDILFLIVGKARYAAFSKYCTSYIETQNVEDGYNVLVSKYADRSNKPIIVTNGDDIITFIDVHNDELSKGFVLPGCKKQGDLEKYIDKYNMTCLAKELGITVPKSKFVMWDTPIDDISYPCFIKPSHQKPGHYNEFKYKLCKDKESLKNALNLVRHDSVFIVQEFVDKEKDLLVYGCRLHNGQTIIAGGLVTERFAIGQGSSFGYVDSQVHPSIDTSLIVKFLERIDYVGLFSFEYGLHDSKAYFFEVNLRNDGTSHFFFQAGANIPLAYVNSCAGVTNSLVSTNVNTPCWYMDEIFDVSNILTRTININTWKAQRNKVKSFKFFDEADIEPYKIAKKFRWIRISRDIILKKFRIYILFILDKIGFRK